MSEQTSVVDTFQWSSLRGAAEAQLDGGVVVPPTVVIPPAESTSSTTNVDGEVKTVEHTVGDGETKTTNATQDPPRTKEAAFAELSDDQLVKVTVDGEEVILPWKEAKGGFMRNAKFTKEMQALRANEETFNTSKAEVDVIREEHSQLATLLSDKTLLAKYVQHQFPDMLPAEQRQMVKEIQTTATSVVEDPNFDPEEIATLGQAKQLIERYQATNQQLVNDLNSKVGNIDTLVESKLEARLTKFNADLDHNSKVSSLNTTITDTIAQIVKDIPLLKAIPNVEQNMRDDVKKMKPKNVEELKQAFATVAHGYREGMEAVVTNFNKTSLVQKEKLTTKTIEPSGGSPVTQQPTSYKTASGEVDWKKLRELAAATLG